MDDRRTFVIVGGGLAGAEAAETLFAAGDVASVLNARYERPIRVEHWANAADQGSAAARAMLGAEAPYATVPFFFSDQYESGLEYYGLHDPNDRVVIRGDMGSGPFQAFWLAPDGSVTAGMHVDDWDATEAIERLVTRGTPVDPARLADPGVALDDLAVGPAPAA